MAPDTLPQARARLAEMGIAVESAAVQEQAATTRGSNVIAGMANTKVNGADSDLLVLDDGLIVVPNGGKTEDGLIADSAMEMYQCKLMVLHAAYKIDRGLDFVSEVSMAKHFVANALGRIIDRAIQVHGALGYSTDTPLASMYQHARWARFADGPDEVHQMRIAQRTIAAYAEHGSSRRATGDLPI